MSTPVHFSDYGKKCKDLLEKKFKKAKKSEFGVKSKSSDGNVEVQTSLVGMAKSKGKMKIKVKPLCSLEVETATDEQMSVKLTAPSLYKGLKIVGSGFFVPQSVYDADLKKNKGNAAKCKATRAEIEASFGQGRVSTKAKITFNGQGWPDAQVLQASSNNNLLSAEISATVAKGIAVGGQVKADLSKQTLTGKSIGAQYTGLPNMIGAVSFDMKKVTTSFHYSGLAMATIGGNLQYAMSPKVGDNPINASFGIEHQFNKNAVFQANFNPLSQKGGLVLEHTLGNPSAKLQLTNTFDFSGEKGRHQYAIYFNLE